MVIEGEVDMAKHDHNNWCMISAVLWEGKYPKGGVKLWGNLFIQDYQHVLGLSKILP